MQINTTGIDGLIEIIPQVYSDNRGWFYEFFREESLHTSYGLNKPMLQENQSFSKKGVVRGLHLQLPPFEQAKIVTVITGRVMDVVVDLRKGSQTFGEVYYCLLDSEKHNSLVIPEGFAHGFEAIEDSIFFYKCSNYYNKESETGVLWNDPVLSIKWQTPNPILSEKDRQLPTLDELLRKSVISRS